MRKVFVIAAAAAIAAMFAGCSSGDEERVKAFAESFAHNVQNPDSVKTMYPTWKSTDSISVKYVVDSVKVEAVKDNEGVYTVSYGNGVEITVNAPKEGAMTITSSKGILAYAPDRLKQAKKFGQWKSGITDSELATRMNDEAFVGSLTGNFVKQFKSNIIVGAFKVLRDNSNTSGPMCDWGGSIIYSTQVINNNDADLDGNDYSLNHYVSGWGGRGETSHISGKKIAAKSSAKLTLELSMFMGSIAGEEPKIKWKLTDSQIFDK